MSTYATLTTSAVVSRKRSDASRADALTPTRPARSAFERSAGAHYRPAETLGKDSARAPAP